MISHVFNFFTVIMYKSKASGVYCIVFPIVLNPHIKSSCLPLHFISFSLKVPSVMAWLSYFPIFQYVSFRQQRCIAYFPYSCIHLLNLTQYFGKGFFGHKLLFSGNLSFFNRSLELCIHQSRKVPENFFDFTIFANVIAL